MIDDDEELAIEWLLGTAAPKGRAFLKAGSNRELKGRAAAARALRKEAPEGYFAQVVANLIDPPRRIDPPAPSAIFTRKFIFQRPRGAPVVGSDRRRAKIAAYMQAQLEKQKRRPAATIAQTRNLKAVVASTMKKFGLSHGSVMKIWAEFRPPKKSPNKSEN
jgi:hypothetical protein